MTKFIFDLKAPNQDIYDRNGIAGLYMTLKQLEHEKVKPPFGIKWKLSDRYVELSWEGKDKDREAIDWILRESFLLDNGMIVFRALNPDYLRKDTKIIIHQAMLGSFLQHNSSHDKEKERKITENLPYFDKEKEIQILVKYLYVNSYKHQGLANYLCDKNGKLEDKPIGYSGWLIPGATVKHTAVPVSTCKAYPQKIFALLFAPVSCSYFILKSRLRDKKAQYAVVLPEINNLENYVLFRQHEILKFDAYKDRHAAVLGDAGFKFLTLEDSINVAKTYDIPYCKVIVFGTVGWSLQQKTRTEVFTVKISENIHQQYYACRHLKNRVLEGKNGSYITTSLAKELIADNLLKGNVWYDGISNLDTKEIQNLMYERSAIYAMIQEMPKTEGEDYYIQAIHQAMRNMFGKLFEKREQDNRIPNFDRITTQIRTGLQRCLTKQDFMNFMADFWANAGINPVLQEHYQVVRDYWTQNDWEKPKNMALYALVSYQSKSVQNQAETSNQTPEVSSQDEKIDLHALTH